jgi:hypothetical protein
MPLFLLQAASDPNEWNRIIAIATVIAAVATVLYFVSTVLLWWTTKNNAKLTKEMFEASHRPYVSITKIENIGLNDEDDEFGMPDIVAIQVNFKNVGTTPAHDLRYEIRVVVDGHLMPAVEEEEEPVSMLFPGAKGRGYISTDDPAQVEEIRNAKTLSLLITYSYMGVTNQRYTYQEKTTYDSANDDFGTVKVTAT